MAVLNRKLLRDLRQSTGVLATVIAIIAIGTGSFIGLTTAQRVLETSQATYYSQYRFADFWIHVKKAPLPAIEPLADLPGIAAIETRITFDVILDLPDVIEPLTGRLISTRPRDFDRSINGICLERGSGFSDDGTREIIISDSFARSHQLQPGDPISLILNRKRDTYTIVGTAISPEYVYMVRGQGDLVPDPAHFGVLYVKEEYAREVLDFKDACNQVIGQLLPGYDKDVDLLLEHIDRILQPYGVLETVPRERHASHRFISDEIAGLGVTAMIMPTIFLAVAALVLNIIMSRLAERQRTIIGTLKALGYGNRQILVHFLGYGLVVGLVGGVAGIGVGLLLAAGMIEMYKNFYQFPVFTFDIYPDLLLAGVAISVAFAIGGTTKSVRTSLKLQPAEAMRPKPPERGGAIFLERFPALWRQLGFRSHIALRGLARHRTRTLTGMVSVMLSTAIILLALASYDSMMFLVDFQFDQVAHSDVDIGMRDERSVAALLEGQNLPGVDYAEPVLGVACDLRHGRTSRRIAISGLSANHRLTTPMQKDFTPIQIPREGLVLSRKLAEILDARIGDRLAMTPVRGRRDTTSVPVVSIVDSFLGLECYADQRYLSRIVGEIAAVNSLQLAVNPAAMENLYRRIKQLPNAQGLSVRSQAKANIENTFMETMLFSLGTMILFASVIALGSILNASLIEIADRIREIATFRVLGYRPNQVAAIFLRQNLVISFTGILLGLPLGYGILLAMARAYDTELFRMPVRLNWITTAMTILISIVFVLLAQWFVYRQIRALDWAEGIKIKE